MISGWYSFLGGLNPLSFNGWMKMKMSQWSFFMAH